MRRAFLLQLGAAIGFGYDSRHEILLGVVLRSIFPLFVLYEKDCCDEKNLRIQTIYPSVRTIILLGVTCKHSLPISNPIILSLLLYNTM